MRAEWQIALLDKSETWQITNKTSKSYTCVLACFKTFCLLNSVEEITGEREEESKWDGRAGEGIGSFSRQGARSLGHFKEALSYEIKREFSQPCSPQRIQIVKSKPSELSTIYFLKHEKNKIKR